MGLNSDKTSKAFYINSSNTGTSRTDGQTNGQTDGWTNGHNSCINIARQCAELTRDKNHGKRRKSRKSRLP